jgi:hypothetical protein
METYDVGIDLVARFKIHNKESNNTEDYFYVAVQSKYRKPSKDRFGREVHKLSWKELSTFLALVQRTGPTKYGGKTKIVMTNADSVSWRGKKKEYNVKTYAKKTFENIERIEWMKIVGKKEEGNILGTNPCPGNQKERKKIEFISSDEESEEDINSSESLDQYLEPEPLNPEEEEKTQDVRELRMKWLDKLKL